MQSSTDDGFKLIVVDAAAGRSDRPRAPCLEARGSILGRPSLIYDVLLPLYPGMGHVIRFRNQNKTVLRELLLDAAGSSAIIKKASSREVRPANIAEFNNIRVSTFDKSLPNFTNRYLFIHLNKTDFSL